LVLASLAHIQPQKKQLQQVGLPFEKGIDRFGHFSKSNLE
jgi:hypothetical protein